MQLPNFRLRSTTIKDVDQILTFLQENAVFHGFQTSIMATTEALEQTLFGDAPAAEVIFAEVNEVPVGFIVFFQTYSSFLAQSAIWIDDLFVQPEWRHKGIGTALFKAVAKIARRRDCGRIEWTVAVNNPIAIDFYRRKGAEMRAEVCLCRMTALVIQQLATV